MKVLLIGTGRMGIRYAEALRRIYGEELSLTSVDPAASCPESSAHYADLEEVSLDQTFDLGIDAHPNIARLEIFKKLTARNIPALVVEKPLASSMEEAKQILDHATSLEHQPRILIPFYRRFLQSYLELTPDRIRMGRLRAINVSGGAIGLGCNGIHHIDFAQFFLKDTPTSIFADLEIDAIKSPRGSEFTDHGGFLSVKYPEASFNLDIVSKSSAGVSITLIFERGKIILPDQVQANWIWFRQPEDQHEEPYYKTHLDKPVNSNVPDFQLDLLEMMGSGLRALLSDAPIPSLQEGYNALKIIALAIASHQQKRPVHWEEDELIEDTLFQFT